MPRRYLGNATNAGGNAVVVVVAAAAAVEVSCFKLLIRSGAVRRGGGDWSLNHSQSRPFIVRRFDTAFLIKRERVADEITDYRTVLYGA